MISYKIWVISISSRFSTVVVVVVLVHRLCAEPYMRIKRLDNLTVDVRPFRMSYELFYLFDPIKYLIAPCGDLRAHMETVRD